MNTPMMWMAAGAVLGAAVWTPGFAHSREVAVMCIGFSAVLTVINPRALHPLLLAIGFTLASTSASLRVPSTELSQHLVGPVIQRTNHSALVRTTQGMVSLRLSDPPLVGRWLTAWIRPDTPGAQLPGEFSRLGRHKRFGIVGARTIAWSEVNQPIENVRSLEHLRFGGIIQAIAAGNRADIPERDVDIMRRTGTIHLLAISGLHIGMVAGMGGALAWLLSRPLVSWPKLARIFPGLGAIGMATMYAHTVGWPVSTQRATMMVTMGVIAHLLGRTAHAWHVWSLALLLVILSDPAQVESIGCWMSFGAVAALIGWMPLWNRCVYTHKSRLLRWIWASTGTTIVATLGTLPVTAWIFQTLSLGAPLANLIAIPLFAGIAVPTAMIGFHGPATGSSLWLEISDMTIGWSMEWMVWTDLGNLAPAVGPLGALLLGIGVFLHAKPWWALCVAILAFVQPNNLRTQFELTFPAIGQGGSALVEFPDGRRWLIDGGPPGKRLLHWLRRKGIRKLDAIFLTHPDIDHMGGLIPVIEALQVDTLWAPRRPLSTERRFHDLWRDANQKGTRTAVFGPATTSSDNDNSLVLRLRHGAHQFLLTGDIGTQIEHRMVPHLEQMTVVQIPHHGSKGSSSESFIAVTNPMFAVVQSGKQNRYGHPHPSVIGRWGPRRCLRTDQDGTIRFSSDGEKVSVASWIPPNGWRARTPQMIRYR